MKSDLQIKFLSFLTGRKKGEGFTLIELLVVIIIIGILAAIALPSFLNQANKAKQSEAKQYVGTLVRTQQAYYLENTEFTTSLDALGKPVATDTTNYSYTMTAAATNSTAVAVLGTAKKTALKGYAGASWISNGGASSEATSFGSVCEANIAGVTVPTPPTFDLTTGVAACGTLGKVLGSK
jgi:type IV pilus assembly protein PilA